MCVVAVASPRGIGRGAEEPCFARIFMGLFQHPGFMFLVVVEIGYEKLERLLGGCLCYVGEPVSAASNVCVLQDFHPRSNGVCR